MRIDEIISRYTASVSRGSIIASGIQVSTACNRPLNSSQSFTAF
jgi:hypothetical protein